MSKRRPPRDKATLLEAISNVATLIKEGSTLQDALDRYRINNTTWVKYRPEGARMRRTGAEVVKLTKKVHALASKGVTIEEATKRIGLKRSVYTNAAKRLGLPPIGATTGSVRADMLPPRPEKGPGRGGYQKLNVPPDMNSVQALAARIGVIDRKLEAVAGLAKDRKTYAKRLMELLRKGP